MGGEEGKGVEGNKELTPNNFHRITMLNINIMKKNDLASDMRSIYSLLCNGQLHSAITHLGLFMEQNDNCGMTDEYQTLSDDFRRMYEYWLSDMKDPSLEAMIEQFSRRTANFCSEYISRLLNLEDSCYLLMERNKANRKGDSWNWQDIRQKLEAFVSDEALASFSFDGETDKEKYYRIVDAHADYSRRLFTHIVTDGAMNPKCFEEVIETLTTPTVDSADQQIIVSALTIAGLRAFDITKFRIMANVCREASYLEVRQRALVGFVLTMGQGMSLLFPEQKAIVEEVLADKSIYSQLLELQMQLVFCVKASDDSKKVQEEIMPGIVKYSDLQVKNGRIVEVEDNSIDDILGKNDDEQRTENVEKLMHNLKDMQDSGADILFGGFSHMKRFPFFDDMANWFLPFSVHNKAVRDAIGSSDFDMPYDMIFQKGGICDNDRYSFVFVFKEVMSRMPENIKELFRNRLGVHEEECEYSPTHYRRNYLQTLYRFFKLFKWRSGLVSPFEKDGFCCISGERHHVPYLFSANELFLDSMWLKEVLPNLQMFLSRNLTDKIEDDLRKMEWPDVPSFEGCMAKIKYLHKLKHTGYDEKMIREALKYKPDSLVAKKLLANILLDSEREDCIEEAKQIFLELVDNDSDNPTLCYKAALTCYLTHDFDKALPLVYKLHYNYPDDDNVNMLFGSLLLLKGDISQAHETLAKVADYAVTYNFFQLSCVVACWLATRSVKKTVEYCKGKNAIIGHLNIFDKGMCQHVIDTLSSHGISIGEFRMMYDAIGLQ